jgi:CheY-like chemotaxis protein
MQPTKHILLVEDNKHDQFFFIDALREIPNVKLYYVANNGQEAIKRLELSSVIPDFIFTDIYMPVMDGLEFITELKKNGLFQNIPIVVFSSASWHIEAAQKLGVKTFIEKPLNDSQWREQIESIINSDIISGSFITAQTFEPGQSSL